MPDIWVLQQNLLVCHLDPLFVLPDEDLLKEICNSETRFRMLRFLVV